jgi:hypothetical protein
MMAKQRLSRRELERLLYDASEALNDILEDCFPDTPEGMSLRDYFAAKAMAAMLSLEDVHLNYGESELATWSYQQADAMLEERNKK